MQGAKQRGRRLAPEQCARQRGDRLRAKGADGQLLGQPQPLQRAHHCAQSRVGACLLQPVSAEQQHPLPRQAPG